MEFASLREMTTQNCIRWATHSVKDILSANMYHISHINEQKSNQDENIPARVEWFRCLFTNHNFPF